MNRLVVKYVVAAAPVLFLLACGRHGAKVSDPLPAGQIRLAFQTAFQTADSATRDAANKVADETEQHQVAAAYADVKNLSALPNLTDDQRIVAIRAANTIGQQLMDAAQNGDQQAADTLQAARHSH